MSEVHRKDEIQGDIIHVYDGIEEADNDLPFWWLLTFYLAVVFAVVYYFGLHEYGLFPTIDEEYHAAVAAHLEQFPPVTPEEIAALDGNEEMATAGRAHYDAVCVVCHKTEGEGDIGPNLTDSYWIHGGSPENIYHTVADGVLDKGMPNWLAALGPQGVKEVTAFVLSIRNTNVEGKEAQGELWADPSAPVDDPPEQPEIPEAPEEALDEAAEEGAETVEAGATDEAEPEPGAAESEE